jgi:ClpP class serine protease
MRLRGVGANSSVMSGATDDLRAAVQAASEDYDADIYIYSGEIDDEGFGLLIQSVPKTKNKRNAILILTTSGGSANAAYQIARLFQKIYKRFFLCAPSYCKSAGTLIALGAHHLLVDSF